MNFLKAVGDFFRLNTEEEHVYTGRELRKRVEKGKLDIEIYYEKPDDRLKSRIHSFFHKGMVKSILTEYEIGDMRNPTPIKNRGQQCFMIAAVQACFACPPITQFIKDNVVPEEEECAFNGKLDRKMKKLLAKYLIGYPCTEVTSGFELFMEFSEGHPHDSEEYFSSINDKYFSKAMPIPIEARTWTCATCNRVQFMEPQGASLFLPSMPANPDEELNMAAFISHKEGLEVEPRTCIFCGLYGEGSVTTSYKFSNMISVYAHTDERVAKFEEFVDLSSLEPSVEYSHWKLAGVVFYRKELEEKNSHYVAVVKMGEKHYLMNDSKVSIVDSPIDYRFLSRHHGRPQYALYYRENWQEMLAPGAQRQ